MALKITEDADEVLLRILRSKNPKFTPVESIMDKLSISKNTTWQHVRSLRALGYDIDAQPHHGLRLISTPDKIIPFEIREELPVKKIGKEVLCFDRTSSTNDAGWKVARTGTEEGTVVFAEGQTKGRGRMGRMWVSEYGKGIYASIILRPKLPPSKVSRITIMASVSTAHAIEKTCGIKPKIRWPNDILIGNRKVSGILTELKRHENAINFVIVGIGINVNQDITSFPGDLRKIATSLRNEVGKEVSRIKLARQLLIELDKDYSILNNGDFSSIRNRWITGSETLGRQVRVRFHNGTIEGYAMDIDEDGSLAVRLDDGAVQLIASGVVDRLT